MDREFNYSKSLSCYIAIVALLLAYVFNQSWGQSRGNWDVVAYTAVALNINDKSLTSEQLHQQTFQQISNHYPIEKINAINNHNEFSREVYASPLAFKEQLPFYQIRPAYNLLNATFHALGINIPKAINISSTASMLIFVILFSILAWQKIRWLGLLAFFYTLRYLDLDELGRYSTPDALISTCMLFGVLLFYKKQFIALCVLSLLCIFIRTDSILFFAPLLLSFAFCYGKDFYKTALITVLLLPICYIGIHSYYQHPGYQLLFYYSFIEHLAYPLSQTPMLDANTLFNTYVLQIKACLSESKFQITLLFFVAGLIQLFRSTKNRVSVSNPQISKNRDLHILLCAAFYSASHIMLFPMFELRFFAASFSIVMILSLYFLFHSSKAIHNA